jgi:glycerol-3-phosphate dehydrogenase
VAETYDIIVIGGGINGAAVARLAANAGFHVALFEKNDFGGGVTSRSTRLIHGGLRYLESRRFNLVRESLREREALLRDYPGLVKPLSFVIPVYKADSRSALYIQAGMWLYGYLNKGGALAGYRRLNAAQLQELEPGLETDDLKAGFVYQDCQAVYPERLALEMALEAEEAGATVRNHTAVSSFLDDGGRINGVRISSNGQPETIRAKLVINAAGPWIDQIRAMLPGGVSKPLITLLNGTHIVVRPFRKSPKHAIYHEARADGRPFFIIPWRGLYLIGTTETPHRGAPENAAATEREVRYLISETRNLLPSCDLDAEAVLYAYAGPRPLIHTEEGSFGQASREHAIYDHEKEEQLGGLLTMVGGKLTTARSFARQVVALAAKKLRKRGLNLDQADLPPRREDTGSLEPRVAEIYGWRGNKIQKLAMGQRTWNARPLAGAEASIAELIYTVESEKARTLGDIMLRRTGLAFDASYTDDWPLRVAEIVAPSLEWNDAALAKAVEEFKTERGQTLQRFPAEAEPVQSRLFQHR